MLDGSGKLRDALAHERFRYARRHRRRQDDGKFVTAYARDQSGPGEGIGEPLGETGKA